MAATVDSGHPSLYAICAGNSVVFEDYDPVHAWKEAQPYLTPNMANETLSQPASCGTGKSNINLDDNPSKLFHCNSPDVMLANSWYHSSTPLTSSNDNSCLLAQVDSIDALPITSNITNLHTEYDGGLANSTGTTWSETLSEDPDSGLADMGQLIEPVLPTVDDSIMPSTAQDGWAEDVDDNIILEALGYLSQIAKDAERETSDQTPQQPSDQYPTWSVVHSISPSESTQSRTCIQHQPHGADHTLNIVWPKLSDYDYLPPIDLKPKRGRGHRNLNPTPEQLRKRNNSLRYQQSLQKDPEKKRLFLEKKKKHNQDYFQQKRLRCQQDPQFHQECLEAKRQYNKRRREKRQQEQQKKQAAIAAMYGEAQDI